MSTVMKSSLAAQ